MVAVAVRENHGVDGSHRVAAVILAAGASRRFGSPKQLASFRGRTLLEGVVDAARAAGLVPVVVVVPPDFAPPAHTEAVVNQDPGRGLSHSLQLGFASLPPDVAAAVVLLGDQPTVTGAAIRSLLSRVHGARPIVATRAEGRIAPPILLRRDAFALVDEASGDSGLAPVLARHAGLVAYVDLEAHLPDVDSPRDLERLEATEPSPPH